MEKTFPEETSSLSTYYNYIILLFFIDVVMNVVPLFIVSNCDDLEDLKKDMTIFIAFNIINIIFSFVEARLIKYYLHLTETDIKLMESKFISKPGIFGRLSKILPILIKLFHLLKIIIACTSVSNMLSSNSCINTGYKIGILSEIGYGILTIIITCIWKKVISVEGEYYIPVVATENSSDHNKCARIIGFSLGP